MKEFKEFKAKLVDMLVNADVGSTAYGVFRIEDPDPDCSIISKADQESETMSGLAGRFIEDDAIDTPEKLAYGLYYTGMVAGKKMAKQKMLAELFESEE